MNIKTIIRLRHWILAGLVCTPLTVHAYVGPGAGLGAIGTVLALLGAVLLGIAGFIWYPIKRLLGLKKDKRPADAESEAAEKRRRDEHEEPDSAP